MLARIDSHSSGDTRSPDPLLPSKTSFAVPATAEEEADIRSLVPHAEHGSQGRIEFIRAAETGPFRVPGDPLSAWTNGMAVEPGSAISLAERYAASDPAAGSRVPPLTWDAVPENRTKPGGSGWRRHLPAF